MVLLVVEAFVTVETVILPEYEEGVDHIAQSYDTWVG
jgi:hypothetical protein